MTEQEQAAQAKLIAEIIRETIRDTAEHLARTFMTQGEARTIARSAVPQSLVHLDESSPSGDTLVLKDGTGQWGTAKVILLGPGFPKDEKVFFGYDIDPGKDGSKTKVRIYTGEIDRIAVAQADVVVANNYFVYVRRTIAGDTMEVMATDTVPADDATYKYYKLYQFAVTAVGVPPVDTTSVLKVCRALAIEGGGGFTPLDDQVLYKGVFLREYDAAGVIVAPGSEINPASYATQALYEAALVAAGHTLKPTWDWVRAHYAVGGGEG